VVSKVTRGVGAAAFGALLCLATSANAELVVSISKSQQRVAVVVDGAETYRWPVSTGARGHETPTGRFRPIRLERHWYSRQYEMTPMPWAMFFHRGYAVHGTMEAYNLGRAASHGCVRLRPDNAATLFSLMRRQGLGNTQIVVKDGALPPLPSPLDAPPAKVSVAEAETPKVDELAAKSFASVNDYSVSVSGNEAQILRERAAWLRGLDRKYGIAR
jgi:L,D-transpeptidase catalytic domain